jgi:hypothetical protein
LWREWNNVDWEDVDDDTRVKYRQEYNPDDNTHNNDKCKPQAAVATSVDHANCESSSSSMKRKRKRKPT